MHAQARPARDHKIKERLPACAHLLQRMHSQHRRVRTHRPTLPRRAEHVETVALDRLAGLARDLRKNSLRRRRPVAAGKTRTRHQLREQQKIDAGAATEFNNVALLSQEFSKGDEPHAEANPIFEIRRHLFDQSTEQPTRHFAMVVLRTQRMRRDRLARQLISKLSPTALPHGGIIVANRAQRLVANDRLDVGNSGCGFGLRERTIRQLWRMQPVEGKRRDGGRTSRSPRQLGGAELLRRAHDGPSGTTSIWVGPTVSPRARRMKASSGSPSANTSVEPPARKRSVST